MADVELLNIPEIDVDNRYALFAVYCNGSVGEDSYETAAALTKSFTSFLKAGITQTNMQSNPLHQPYHLTMVAAVFREQDGTVMTTEHGDGPVFSEHYSCTHRDEKFHEYDIKRLFELNTELVS